MVYPSISRQALQRLPLYLNYLKALPDTGPVNISATLIADGLKLNQVQVRKDLAAVSSGGRPKTGYIASELIADISRFLGYDNVNNAVLAGAGRLGRVLLSHEGFHNCGIDIVAAFDTDEALLGSTCANKPVFRLDKMKDLCKRLNVHIGIITVPADAAQSICDRMVDSGILAVWNFTPVHLKVPEYVLVENENIVSTLAVLSKHVLSRLQKTGEKGAMYEGSI